MIIQEDPACCRVRHIVDFILKRPGSDRHERSSAENPPDPGSVDRTEADRHREPPEVDLKTEMEPGKEGLPPGVRKVIVGEKEAQEWSCSLDQEDPGIKDEQEEVSITQFVFSPVPVKSKEEEEGDEERPESSQLPHSQTEEIPESVGGAEPDPEPQPEGKTFDSSGTDVSDADREQSCEPAAPQTSCDDGEKLFSCSVCGKKFGHSRNLNRHLRAHTGEKPISCCQCGKRFVDSGNLQRHMGIHTEKKPFSCSECGRGFKDKTTLTNHLRTHTGEKPFSCKFCSKTFTHSGNLKQHLCIHTGEKPYSCCRCSKTFGRNADLNSHMLIHTGEKAFSCSECGRRFTHRRSLKQHLKSHAGEKPSSRKRFGNSADVKKHLRTRVTENSFRNIPGKNISCSAD